jgi:hypothetical protein
MQSLAPGEVIALLESDAGFEDIAEGGEEVLGDPSRGLDLAHEAVQHLAAGIVEQFERARAGHPLVHDIGVSPWLRSAMFRLAALHVMHGRQAKFDGAHTVVAMSCEPLRQQEWGLPVFDSSDFRFHGVRLLDPGSRLPTLECVDLAQRVSSELDLREQQAFAQLTSVSDLFSGRRDEVYTALRSFVIRHPTTTAAEQRRYLAAQNLQLAAPFLATCYETPQPHHLVQGALLSCATCGVPMKTSNVIDHVGCVIRQCKSFDVAVPRSRVRPLDLSDALVAKPHILVYWCGPGLDEIALFDYATSEPLRLDALLFPKCDACDISLDADTTGIDVKSHANPFLLAEILNHDLGSLERYDGKIIAINDQAVSRFPDYLEILRREFSRPDVKILSVSGLRRELRART